MRKSFLALFGALVLGAAAFAQAGLPGGAPEGAFVFDAGRVPGKFKDNIVVVCKSQSCAINVNLYVYDHNAWTPLDNISLNSFDAEQKIKPPKGMKFSKLPYYCVESTDGKPVVCKLWIDSDDLYIEVRDEGSDLSKAEVPAFPREGVFTFDGRTLGGKIDENIKIRNYTKLSDIEFQVSVYDAETRQWLVWGSAEVNGYKDVTKAKGKGKKLKNYRYFAVEPLTGGTYTFSPVSDDDDLIINVNL